MRGKYIIPPTISFGLFGQRLILGQVADNCSPSNSREWLAQSAVTIEMLLTSENQTRYHPHLQRYRRKLPRPKRGTYENELCLVCSRSCRPVHFNNHFRRRRDRSAGSGVASSDHRKRSQWHRRMLCQGCCGLLTHRRRKERRRFANHIPICSQPILSPTRP